MKLLFTTYLVVCAFILTAQVENGCISIDFESFPNETPTSGLVLSDQYKEAFGLSFRLEGGGFPVLADVGGNSAEAFGSAWGNDTPAPGVDIGGFFLTDDGQLSGLTSPPIILDFEIPIDSFAGCILDMDFEEFFIIQALDETGAIILEERIDAGDPGTGDGALTCWGFNLPGCEGSIYSIRYAGFRPASSPGAFGLGMDFFSFCYSGLQIDTETTPVTCNELGSINIFSTTNEIYEYSLDGVNYSTNGFFEQLNAGIQVIYVKDSDDCTTSVEVNVELEQDDLPDPIFVEEEICDGESYSFNGEVYVDAGTYQQTLIAPNGCDTTWNLTLNVLPTFSEFLMAEICEGETFNLNGESYTTGGLFEQEFTTVEGCDSIVQLDLTFNSNSEELMFAQICEGQMFELNGEMYSSAGNYTQDLTNTTGCDSTLNLQLELLPSNSESLTEEICEGSEITINGTSYNSGGTYSQILINSEGCDSILNITISILPVIETCQNISIFEGEVYDFNGEIYSVSGTYEQLLQSTAGCDSLAIIKLDVLPLSTALVHYDLDNCAAGGSSYNEFNPRYDEELDCADIIASILYRPSGRPHSCTPGETGSGMCVSSDPSCVYQEESVHRLIFEVFVNPTTGPVSISGLRFFEKAPINYQFNVGGTGPNNYPTLYSIKISKGTTEIYSTLDISTNRDWTLQSFSFNGLDPFVFEEAGTLKIEFLAFCPIGISSNVSAWDIDELSLLGYCQPESRTVNGNIMTTKDEPMSRVKVAVNENDKWKSYVSDNNGEFAFNTDYNQRSVLIEPYNNDEPLNGVSTLDLIFIQRHILGLETFEDLSDLVAADINKDDKVSVLDLIELRRLILGIYEEFPQNTSWRFLDADQKYNTLSELEDQMMIRELNQNIHLEGIKVGDVDQSYVLSSNKNNIDSRNKSQFNFDVKEYTNENGQLAIGYFASEDIVLSGLQATFNIDGSTAIELVPHKISIAKQNYHVNEDVLKISWSEQHQDINAGDLLFEFVFDADEMDNNITLDSNAKNELYTAEDFESFEIVLENKTENQLQLFEDVIQVNIHPNPFRDVTQVRINSKESFTAQYKLIDATGKVINTRSLLLEEGVNTVNINRSELPGAGIYFMMVRYNQSVFVERIVLF